MLVFSFFSCLILATCLASKHDDNNNHVSWTEKDYDEHSALSTLYYAYGAYCDESSLVNWDCKWCDYAKNFTLTYVISKYKLQAYVGYNNLDNEIIISFRGTHNIIDWLDDFEMRKVEYPQIENGKVHNGFYKAWQHLKDGILNATYLLIDKYPSSNLVITGHSLGAALSQLSAIDVKLYLNNTISDVNKHNKIYVINFGSPRVFNDNMANYYSYQINQNWRIVNHHDIVPTLPPHVFGYRHTWTEVWYTQYKPTLNYTICDINYGEDKQCSYPTYELSAEDHLWYLGVHENCGDDEMNY